MAQAKAVPILRRRRVLPDGAILEAKVWLVPTPVPPSRHPFKYSLFFGYPGQRLVGYDNERGKGDHKHVRGAEMPYVFVSIDQLLADFAADVAAVRRSPP